MATLVKNIGTLLVSRTGFIESQVNTLPLFVQNRFKSEHMKFYGWKNHWPKYTMMKDHRKRMTLKEYGPYKLRYNGIRKAELLPLELREIADHEIASVPVDAALLRIVPRCSVSSKPRGNVLRFKLSRHIFRHLADYNKLSGVQRGMW